MKLIKRVFVAAVAGTCIGAIAGFLSVPKGPPHPTATTVNARPAPLAALRPAPRSSLPEPATRSDIVTQARALASIPDVSGLVVLRKQVLTNASKLQIQEIDRSLDEARALRLKLDGLELRKTMKKRP